VDPADTVVVLGVDMGRLFAPRIEEIETWKREEML
jgi:hypothetical protein